MVYEYIVRVLEEGDIFFVVDVTPEFFVIEVPGKGHFDLPLSALPKSAVGDGHLYQLVATIMVGDIKIPVVTQL
jgi:hypothetical protein